MPAPPVLVREDGGVAHLTLNRPTALNAITLELARTLELALREASAGVIVLRGAGGNFSVGGDYKELESEAAGVFEAFGRACAVIAELPVPVVAAVEGYALAGGFELMQACDVVLVSDEARIGDHHARFGMVPGGGSSQRLPRVIGRQRALGLLLTGDHLSGAEAAAWGLAYRAVPAASFEGELAQLCQRLAAADPAAAACTKALVQEGLELPLREGLARERAAVVEHLARPGALARFAGA